MNQQDLDRLTTQMNQFMERENRKKFPTSKVDELAELGVKRCSTCATVKNIEEFGKHSGKRDGLEARCKACHRENAASYREANPDYHREYHRIRYRDPEDIRRLTMQLDQGYHRTVRAGNKAVRVTPEDLLAHWESIGIDPWTCYLTGEPLDHLTRSIDHIVAISNGGSHTADNLAPCTETANKTKKTATADEAKERLAI